MEPKFQSTFIPRGPVANTISTPMGTRAKTRSLTSFISVLLFVLSGLLAVGVFSYKMYLNYRIAQMGKELEDARTAIAPQTINEILSLDNRIVSSEELLKKHKILSPLFDFLEETTPKSVRYTDFNYVAGEKGITLLLKGEAQGYIALAQAAEIFNKSKYFKEPVFSDLNLDEKGNVVFSLKTTVDQSLLSYTSKVEKTPVGQAPVVQPFGGTSTSSSTTLVGTSTKPATVATTTRATSTKP